MRRMLALSVGAVTALMFVCGTARAEKKENPMYTMWAKFKPGSSATISAVSDMAGQTTKSETKTTLKSALGMDLLFCLITFKAAARR